MSFFSITKMLFASLLSKPETIKLSELNTHYTPRTRGHIENDIKTCIFCNLCARRCPTYALGVDKKDRIWTIEPFKCIQCSCCVEICPVKCLNMANDQTAVSPVMYKDTLTSDA
jgi:formate hydrogenlyase subunit 6/NADH:ubiquinone oxidoreductase subunit I